MFFVNKYERSVTFLVRIVFFIYFVKVRLYDWFKYIYVSRRSIYR